MNVSIEKLPQSRVRVRIEVPADEVRPFLESAARELSKEHAPKGFRPGAAPLEIMRNTVGDATIAERALKTLVPRTFVDALLDRDDIEAIGSPEVEVETVAFDSPWVYRAAVAVLPNVQLGDYQSIRAERKAVVIESGEVGRELEQLRKLRATYLTVPRAAGLGDLVEVDIVATVDRVPLEAGAERRQSMLLGDGHLVPGFEEQLLGMKEGQTKSFSLPFPENHHRADLRGRTAEFTVTLHAVQQQILPEVTDHFAQGLGKFQNLEDLKSKLAAHLREERELKERERFHQELLNAVVERATYGEFPDVLVERELETMLTELKEGVTAMGLTFADYCAQIKKTEAELRAGLKPQGLRRVQAGLTLRAIAKAEALAATDAEITEEVNAALKSFPNPQDAAQKLDPEALKDAAAGAIRNRKVFEFLEALASRK